MPYITIKLVEGRTPQRKELLAQRITQATSEVLEIDPTHVRIEFIELAEGTFAVAGKMVKKATLEGNA